MLLNRHNYKTNNQFPERVLQFGEGNFLRAFADEMIDRLNEECLFNGSIVVVQPIKEGLVDMINKQDGLYTLLLRGIENGNTVCNKRVITSISRGINPYSNYDEYIECAKNPELKYIISNTTEAGIAYNESDSLDDKPQNSFPGKVTAFLYERYKHFEGDIDKGLVFLPCELIDYNGTMLKAYVQKHVVMWGLRPEFMTWVNKSCIFTNTLVDRIVTGYPRDEIKELTEELGYEDNLLDTGEIFHFWVIEGPTKLQEELPFNKIGLNVLFTDDATPYKVRKVRILNGAHTMSVLAAYLSGIDTVGEIMDNEYFNKYIQEALFNEVIPTLDLDKNDLVSFSAAVFDRFSNPYIKHLVLNIALNSTSKFKARVLPSIIEYYNRKKELPKILTFSFAALLAFYKGEDLKENTLIGRRDGEPYNIKDERNVLTVFYNSWNECDMSREGINNLVCNICYLEKIWGLNLNKLKGFTETVSNHLYNIMQNGMYTEVKKLLC